MIVLGNRGLSNPTSLVSGSVSQKDSRLAECTRVTVHWYQACKEGDLMKHVHSFAERHPDKREKILSMAEQNSAFKDMCARFGRMWDSLNEMENEPQKADQARNEARNLEQEMLSMVDHMRP